MQHSKINWLFKLVSPGLLLITSLALVCESFLLYQAKNNLQKLTAIVFLLYCIFLIIKKYSWFNLAVVVLILTFGMLSYFDQKTTDIQLTDQTQILVYPDEVKIEDGWLSGIGKTEQGKVTIAGNVKDDQNQYFADGNPVILSHITGEIETISPATNCGEFGYQKLSKVLCW